MRALEAGVVEKERAGQIDRSVERAAGEPGEPLEHRIAQQERSIEGGAGKIQVGEPGAREIEGFPDGQAGSGGSGGARGWSRKRFREWPDRAHVDLDQLRSVR